MIKRPTVSLSLPWIFCTAVAAFLGKEVTEAVAGQAWAGYVVFLIIMMVMLLLFSWSRSARQK